MFGFNLKSKFRMKLFIFHTVSSPIQFCIFCIHKVVWRKSTKNRLSISKYHNIIVAIIKEKSSNLFALRCPTGQRVAFLYTTRSFLCWMTGRPSSRPSWASPKRKPIWKSDLGTFCPEVFRFPGWLLWLYPPSPPVFQHGRERAVKGASHRCFQRPALDRLSRLCFFSGKRRGYILQSRPLSQEWERAWGLG